MFYVIFHEFMHNIYWSLSGRIFATNLLDIFVEGIRTLERKFHTPLVPPEYSLPFLTESRRPTTAMQKGQAKLYNCQFDLTFPIARPLALYYPRILAFL